MSDSLLRSCDRCGWDAPMLDPDFIVLNGRRLCSFCGYGVPRGRMSAFRQHARTYREEASAYARGGAQIVQGFQDGG